MLVTLKPILHIYSLLRMYLPIAYVADRQQFNASMVLCKQVAERTKNATRSSALQACTSPCQNRHRHTSMQ